MATRRPHLFSKEKKERDWKGMAPHRRRKKKAEKKLLWRDHQLERVCYAYHKGWYMNKSMDMNVVQLLSSSHITSQREIETWRE